MYLKFLRDEKINKLHNVIYCIAIKGSLTRFIGAYLMLTSLGLRAGYGYGAQTNFENGFIHVVSNSNLILLSSNQLFIRCQHSTLTLSYTATDFFFQAATSYLKFISERSELESESASESP